MNSLEQIARLPLLWISLAFMGGVVLASSVVLPFWMWAILAAIALLFGLVVRLLVRDRFQTLHLFLPMFMALGAFWYQFNLPTIDSGDIAFFNDTPEQAWVTGSVAEPPDVRDSHQNLRLDASAIDFGGGDIPVEGQVLIRLRKLDEIQYGDIIRVRGYIETPPESEDFSYRDYLAQRGIHSLMRVSNFTLLPGEEKNPFADLLFRVKTSLLKVNYQLFPDPEAPLLAGILFGADNNLPPNLQDAFKNTGTSHIIAISGFNIAIIAGIFVALFSRLLGKKLGAVTAILGIMAYTLLVGADPAVVRAAIMGTLSIIAAQFGRRNLALNALATVALVMTLINPLFLWDVGFQLSVMATLGLVLYADPLASFVERMLARVTTTENAKKIIAPLSEYVLMTLAAQLTTIPVIAYHFQRISLVSFIANPFILPVQPPVMLLGGLAVLLGRIFYPLGQLVAFFAWPFPAYTIRAVEFFNGFPNGVWVLGDFSLLFVIVFYGILFFWTFAAPRFESIKDTFSPSVVTGLMAVLVLLTWRSALNLPDKKLHITFFDVGSGDAIFIETPSGGHVLINGGPSASQLSDQLGRRIPPFDRKLDALFIASPLEAQVTSLPRTVERYLPGLVVWAGNRDASYSGQLLAEMLTRNAIEIEPAIAGELYSLGDGAELKVLAVSPRGAVLEVSWKNFRAVLPLGLNFDNLEALGYGKKVGSVNVLLLADQGYVPSNPPEWLDALNPQVVVLSVAANDPNGMPPQEMLDQLDGYTLLRTDVNGWIEASTDGEQMWLRVERKR